MKDYHIFLMEIYQTLLNHFGPRGWWPGESRLEIILGAVLTQAVAWKNVKKAIDNLKENHLIDIIRLAEIKEPELAELIKPALYHRQKAKKLKAVVNFITREYNRDVDLIFNDSLEELRPKLLSVWGIGPETADSILLYAGKKRIFVVDTYTCRIFSRLGIVSENTAYHEMQEFMQKHVEPDIDVYNEYHALLVTLGANYCKKSKPICQKCPIVNSCKYTIHLQEK